MHIVFIAENIDLPESHLLKGLVERDIKVTLLTPTDSSVSNAFRGSRVDLRPIRLNARVDPRAIGALRSTIQSNAVDIVHCLRNNRPVANALLALRGLRIPIVCYRGTLGNLHKWDPGSRLTYLSRRLHRIVCVSEAVRNYLLSLDLPPERLVTIHKGHDPGWHQAPPVNLTQFGIPRNSFVVACTANMRPLKGADILIQSAQHLMTDRPIHFLLVGHVRDSRVEKLARQAPFREIVHLAGFRKDAAAITGSCDAFVMPSLRREGLPRAVIEAMSQSVPAIVTDVGGMPELIVNGECGYVIPPNDPIALGNAISRLAADPEKARQFGTNARHRIKNEFNIEKSINKTIALYRSIMR